MLERERHQAIVKLVRERSIVSVSELSEAFEVSEATIRRDIVALSDQGEVKRIRGGIEAIHSHPPQPQQAAKRSASTSGASSVHQRSIARAAAELIEAGDSIIIHGSPATAGLVEFLTNHELDILTNSYPLASKLVATSRNRITLPGGTLFQEHNIVLSPFTTDGVENFWANKMFTSCFGLNRFGLLEADPVIVQAQTKLMKRADQLIVMADSSKLRQKSAMIVVGLERISTLVTDEGASDDELEIFRKVGIKVIVASADKLASSQQSA